MRLTWVDRRPDPNVDGPSVFTSVTADEAATLRALAAGKDVLEIGAAYGFSSCVLGLVAHRVVSIDPHQQMPTLDAMQNNLRAYGLQDKVTVLQGSSQDICPTLTAGSFDLAFVDADHSEEACRHDAKAVWQLVRPGGMVAFHDWHEATCPGVTAALSSLFPAGPDRLVDTLYIVRRREDLSEI